MTYRHMNKQAALARATHIKRTLGFRAALGFMRKQGFSYEAVLWHLLRTVPREFPLSRENGSMAR